VAPADTVPDSVNPAAFSAMFTTSSPAMFAASPTIPSRRTVISTSSVVASPRASVTVSRKVSVIDDAGAVKVAVAVFAPVSVTVGVPPVCVQA